MSKPVINIEDIENLALNPKVNHFACVKNSKQTKKDTAHWKRNIPVAESGDLQGNFLSNNHQPYITEKYAVLEASRCLQCADAPCQKSCPTQIDIKAFIGMIASKNYYGAAKMIFSDNPVGLSCGMICPTSNLCAGSCNLSLTEEGPINIGGLQSFACEVFKRMNVKQIRDPALPPVDQLPESYKTKIALIGCGPASVSCASFLARIGYSDITIFEKESFPGGLSSLEIPQTRLPYEAVSFEVKLMMDLGVNVEYGKALGKDFTIQDLLNQGYKAVFCGIGQPNPKVDKVFDGLTETSGFFTSKSFLPRVMKATKQNMCGCGAKDNTPKLQGKVIVLGIGDTACDCATSAIRCGAKSVSLAFRSSFSKMRAVEEEFSICRDERCDILPNVVPRKVLLNQEGKICGLEFCRTEYDDNGKLVVDEEQTMRVKCDYIISAFGSQLADQEVIKAASPITFDSYGIVEVDNGMQCKHASNCFAGGDCVGNGLTVEASNDGKVASWSIHRFIQKELFHQSTISDTPQLPNFYTEIDLVDISVEFCGMKFPNPMGLASAPPATTIDMIKRSFEAGWGWAVTKTFSMDTDAVINVSPRIIKGETQGNSVHLGPHQSSYLNIELISEKSASYWVKGITELKKMFPDRIVVASIMAGFTGDSAKYDWQFLAKKSIEAGADALELNLSCPHGMGEKGLGLACGQDEKIVTQICKWVREACGNDEYPFFAKLTPNVTEVVYIARAAINGGATGVTATNTVSGLMKVNPDATPWPAVGISKRTTYGGISGNAIRPIAMKAVSSIARAIPNIPITATGGADTADAVLGYIYVGAPVVQICSSIQNQDFTIIRDYISGLRALLFLQSYREYANWRGQCPPELVRHESYEGVGKGLPKFGPYLLEKREQMKQHIAANGGVLVPEPEQSVPHVPFSGKILTIKDVLGKGLKNIVKWYELDANREMHVVALVNDDLCVNCGRCYMACNDSGYQAIKFDPKTHIPVVTDDCTGCTLCLDACPIADCIEMVPRAKDKPYAPKRGIPLGDFSKPVKISVE